MRNRILPFAIGLLSIAVVLCPGRSDAQKKLPVTVVSTIGEPHDPDRAAFSPNGKLVAIWDSVQPSSVMLWDVASGRPLRTLRYPVFFQAVVFSPDGRFIASAHKDGTVKLWDVASGNSTATFSAGSNPRPDFTDAVEALWIDQKGALLVAGNRSGLTTIWDIAKRKRIAGFTWSDKSGEHPHIIAARLTTDGSGLIILTSDSLKIIDARTKKLRQSVTPPKNYEFSDYSIVSDNEFVVKYSGPKCKLDPLFLFDLKEITRLINVDVPAQCDTKANDDAPDGEVRLFADQAGQKLVIVREGVADVKVWDLKSRSPERTVTWPNGAGGKVVSLAPDFKSAVVHDAGRLRIHQFDSGTLTRELTTFGYGAENAVVSPDGRQIFLSHRQPDADTNRKDVDTWQVDEANRTTTRFAAGKDTTVYDVSPAAKLAVGGNEQGEVVLFSTETGQELRRFPVPGFKSVDRARLTPDGTMAVVLGDNAGDDAKSSAVVLDTKDGKVRLSVRARDSKPDSSAYPFSIALSPDGTKLAVGMRDGSAEIWSTDQMNRIKVLPADKTQDDTDVRTLAFSSDGQFLLGGSLFDARAFMWNVATGRLLRGFDIDTTRATYPYVSGLALSRDGKLLAGGLGQRHISSGDIGAERGGIAVWDVATGKLRSILRGHLGAVYAITFSQDDRRIISASLDGTIRYWDRASGEALATISAGQDGRWLVTTQSGFFAGSDDSADLIAVVRGLETYPGTQFRDQLHRPDLVRELLKGDPERRYRDAAQKLDLEKILESIRPH